MAPLVEIFWFLLDPWLFMFEALKFLPSTIIRLIRTRQFRTLLSPRKLQSAWFGTFWAWAGPRVRETGEKRVVPLLQGRVKDGKILADGAEGLGGGIRGTVIEVGPGTGMWVSLFSDAYLADSSSSGDAAPLETSDSFRQRKPASGRKVARVYGVEPNVAVHPELIARVEDAGLQGIYEIVPLGIESLAKSGRVEKESVDCIVSILCLCSIPDPEHNLKELYGYLKPGGRWFVYEHVKCSNQNWGMVLYQGLVNIIWPHILGGCQLQRDTEKSLRDTGPWTKVDLAQPDKEPWYHPLPHVLGTLTK